MIGEKTPAWHACPAVRLKASSGHSLAIPCTIQAGCSLGALVGGCAGGDGDPQKCLTGRAVGGGVDMHVGGGAGAARLVSRDLVLIDDDELALRAHQVD